MKAASGLLAGPVVFLVLIVLAVVVVFGDEEPAAACRTASVEIDPATVPEGPIAGYGHEQLVNAAYVMNAAAALELDSQAQTIGVMTAMGESGLRVLDNGDAAGPDSRGLFQQRGNGAWGSHEDRMDPFISSTNFFRALTEVPGWEQLRPTIAAHKVQRNSNPEHYARYQPAATEVLTALAGVEGEGAVCGGDVVLPMARPFTITSRFGPRPAPVPGASSVHPAVDLYGACGEPVLAATAGTVTLSDRLFLSVKTPAGYTVSYLHMHKRDRLVDVGDTVTPGQTIGASGNEAPASGCHLDFRVNVAGNTDPIVAGLPLDARMPGWVNPEDYFAAFGIPLEENTTRGAA